MNAQLIICDRISNNEQLKGHSLGTILNHLTIPVLPFVIELHVLVKLFDLPREESIDTVLTITHSNGEIIGKTPTSVLRNYRAEDQIPGVDQDLTLTLVITEPGILYIQCMVNGETATWYPLTIRLQESQVS
ncbi:hypothetical protein [Paenibacillus lutrae]|uniref:hypothetical protein n=1 Tax=Paenibacillus lutrae TaxID=2078573 RepID=UPI001F414028|nr:hypothetical protein [Paenibacillus lutrae]